MIKKLLFLSGALALCSVFILCRAVWADETTLALTDEQKTEKRLLFSQYVEDEMARASKRKYEEKQRRVQDEKIAWISKFSTVYGQDSNVNLDSVRRNDAYYQETAEGFFQFDRPVFKPLVWPGKIGVNWYAEAFNYETFSRTDYNTLTASSYTEDRFTEFFTLKLAYDFNWIRYTHNDQLTYSEHKFKPMLTHHLTKSLSHNIFVVADTKFFRDRMALNEKNLIDDDNRHDRYYEAGYGVRWSPDPVTYVGSTAAWKRNDSNDKYNDYNDYEGHKINGYIYRKLFGPLSVVLLGGYDFKDYSDRVFTADGATESQKDDFFYGGSYFYYDITANWQATLSYLYKQNYSNDAAFEYSGYTYSAGFNLTF